ncbi:MAG TPA: diacylglycerol kinase family protein [Fontimonas sp.]
MSLKESSAVATQGVAQAVAGESGVAAPALFIVLNAASGRTGADERVEILRRVFAEAGRRFEFFPVAAPRLLAQTAARAAAQALSNRGVLVAVGGDGTLNAVAQAALDAGCLFGALPQGTFNYFGRAHGISQDLETAARALLRAREATVQTGTVNGKVFLVNASLGLYRRLLEDREAYKNQLGRRRWVAALSALASLLRGHGRLNLSLEVDGELRTVHTPTLFVGNNAVQFQRLGMDVALAALQRGELAAVTVRTTRASTLLGLALRGALGDLSEAENLDQFPLRRMTVHLGGRRRVKVATDGEIHRLRPPLQFEVSPQPLRMMLPLEADRVEVA